MSSLIRLKAIPEIELLGSERCDVSTITSKESITKGILLSLAVLISSDFTIMAALLIISILAYVWVAVFG